jgi:uncharacterized protein (TIGR02996 family)
MSEEAMLIEAILSEPDDHVHRLVYADWLLENAPQREPLVRSQGELGPSVVGSLGQKLVPIPAGRFTMGSPEDEPHRDPDETPHPVTLTKPFYLGAAPVSRGQFRAFVEAAGYVTDAERAAGTGWNAATGEWEVGYSWTIPGWRQKDDEPVVCLSWEDAIAFCAWLSQQEGRAYRLPTEAEWEYACRAGTSTPFFFGATLSAQQANFNTEFPYPDGEDGPPGVLGTTRPGRYPPNAFGLYDMHGNVWEWCNDWYGFEYFESSRERDPRGARNGVGRVLRGGAWGLPARDCRSALRRCGRPEFSRYRDMVTGFRLALSMPRPAAKRKRAARKPR